MEAVFCPCAVRANAGYRDRVKTTRPARGSARPPLYSSKPISSTPDTLPDFSRFAIGFDPRDRARLHELWDEVIDSQQWAEGPMVERFESAWGAWNGETAVAVSSW